MPSNSDPKIIRMLKEYRQSLIDREINQTERLAKSWILIEQQLHDEMVLLALQIQEAKLSGSVITEQLLMRMSRYEQLQSQMEKQILKYAKTTAADDISKEQFEYGKLALQVSQDAIGMSFQYGIAFDKLPVSAVENYVGLLGDGTPLYRLLKEAYPDALDGVVKEFLLGAAKGLNPNQIAYNAARSMGLGLERITLIARTEQLRVNRLVSANQYRTSGLEGVMKRVATKDDRTCPACLALDGEIIPLDQELDDHPRGRCVAIFQIKGTSEIQWEKGKDWFARQETSLQKEILGDTKYQMWENGTFQFEQLGQKDYNPVWGNSPRVATIEELSNANQN